MWATSLPVLLLLLLLLRLRLSPPLPPPPPSLLELFAAEDSRCSATMEGFVAVSARTVESPSDSAPPEVVVRP